MRLSKLTATVIATAALGLIVGTASASEGPELKHVEFSFEGVFGTYDKAAAQRGFQVYQESCTNCHSMKLLSIRNLGEAGGPFYDEEHPNANENPVIKAIAAMFTVTDGPDSEGDMFERPAKPFDRFPSPFANEQAARASNGGALPPDFSVLVSAREHGPQYIYSLLTSYEDDAPEGVELRDGMNYNAAFKGGQIGMPPPLFEDLVEYSDGTKASVEQMAHDVVTFMAWASDPKMEERKRMGWMVMIYLFIFALLMYGSYKAVWRDVEH
ncbi:MAG: cytochrome c1 [Robiginitomaculum sp.]|nr:MAG: cytochrome c1 [Robiginitomaculum sp.]